MEKNFFIFFLSAIMLCQFSISAEVTGNLNIPAGISGKNPGRSLHLTEVQRITDYEEDFVFKRIRGIKIAEDGSIFIRGTIQVLKFTPEGKYVKNFIKKGEGPGEVKYLSDFILSKDNVLVGSIMPVKLINFSQSGTLKSELTIQGLSTFASLFEHFMERSYFVSSDLELNKQKSGVISRANELSYIDQSGKVIKMNLSFDTKDLMIKKSSKNGVMVNIDELTRFLRAFDKKRYLYLSYKERYHISQIDLESGKIVREIIRNYKPVTFEKIKYTKKEDIELYKLYDRKYYNDIYKLAVYKNNLIIFTSTMNKKGEILIDVFNSEGKYIDNFFVKIPGVKRPDDLIRKPVLFHHGYLWTTGTDEDDVPYAVKFEIENM